MFLRSTYLMHNGEIGLLPNEIPAFTLVPIFCKPRYKEMGKMRRPGTILRNS